MDQQRRTILLFLVATCFAAVITPLLSNTLNLALVHIEEDFDVSAHYLGYVNTAYLLGSVVGMVPVARIADAWGLRKTFRAGLVMSAITQAMMFFTPNFEFLLIMRFVSGVVLSFVLVTSLTLISYLVPPEQRGWAIGVNTGAVYLGIALGPFIGGIITDHLGWEYIFVLIFLLSIVALALSIHIKSEIVLKDGVPIDWKGAVGWGASMFILMLGIVNLTEPWAWVMIIVGTALLLLEIKYLQNRENPIFKVSLFRDRGYAASSIASFMNYSACYSVGFFLSLYLQSIGQMTATDAGMLMLIQPVIQIIAANAAGRLYDRTSDKRLLQAIGAVGTAIGVQMLVLMGMKPAIWYVAATLIVFGFGLGMFSTPNTTLIMSMVDPKDRGDASSTIAIMRQTGMMMSMGIAMGCISVIMGSTENLKPENYGLFLDTMHLALGICLITCIIGIICTITARKMKI